MSHAEHPWAVVIFASRESVGTLSQALAAAMVAAKHCARVEVLVNGNPQLATDISASLQAQQANALPVPALKVWSIPLGDKANAWNQYIHRIWNGEELAFFIDGYVRPLADAIELLGHATIANPLALGGTGVPSMGRSAKALRHNLIVNTGFHGNFCCVKGSVLAQMRARQITLPLGLYRVDSLMGAILCYALDPGPNVWEDHRILVHPTASWQIDHKRWWQFGSIKSYLQRRARQARGELENKAFSEHLALKRLAPDLLPSSARSLVLDWAERYPAQLAAFCKGRPLVRRALQQFRLQPPPYAPDGAAPVLIWPASNCKTTSA